MSTPGTAPTPPVIENEVLRTTLTDAVKRAFKETARKCVPWAVVLIGFYGLTSFFSWATLEEFGATLEEFKATRTQLQTQVDTIAEAATVVQAALNREYNRLSIIAPALNDVAAADEVRSRAEAVLNEPDGFGGSLEKTIAYAYLRHLNGDTADGVDRLRAIARALEGVDDEQAADMWYAGGSMLQDIDDGDEEVVALFSEAIRLNPEHFRAYNNRGIENANLGHYAAAAADFSEVIRLSPNAPQGYTNRATMNAERGNHANALRDFDAALERAPGNAITHMDRAASLVALERIGEACDGFATALNLARTSGNAEVVVSIMRQSLENRCN